MEPPPEMRSPEPPGGDRDAFMERVYEELRAVGRQMMRRESPGHTLQPTVLVHEAFLRLSRESRSEWSDETHVRAIAATVMRRVLIDHARSRNAVKRGGGRKVSLGSFEPEETDVEFSVDELLALSEALDTLETLSPRQARVVELRFFGGMGFEHIATDLGVSVNTAKNDWRFARVWLRRKMSEDDAAEPT